MFKPVLMIHGIKPEYFDHDLSRFILTFDDGLTDHWAYFDRIRSLGTETKFFITCSWIGQQNFLSLQQLKIMSQEPDVEIGGHGFSHRQLNRMNIQEMETYIIQEVELMCEWFLTNLGFTPKSMAFPSNDSGFGIYEQVARTFGITKFYGGERIDIEWLNDANWTQGRF